ncbi:S8 family serine peptidase [Bifidobacterium leontopitheci]|uniref:Subtilase family n=1 Tax=Bifidobacterium leontopitheci TaxID=2650774 RepID=A0A6I1GQN2_9BIFI|nr:S8 family serine peptidase [Bifidobacterium leontopitheci]KAB7790408.1 Subtilase family [Bifidobacterium leontopitheci]
MQHSAFTRKLTAGFAAVAMAASCIAIGAVGSAAYAADATPVYSPVEPSDNPRNYAVNLPEGATEAQVKAAVAEAEKLGGVALSQYPQFGTFFVQAKSKSFAKDYAEAATKAGIKVDSVGATRQAYVTGSEDVVDKGSKKTRSGASTYALRKPKTVGQFAKEQALAGDPYTTADKAWGVLALGADKAKDVTDKDVPLAPVTVGIIDSGVDYRHADFKNKDGSSQIDFDKSVDCSVNGVPSQQQVEVDGQKVYPWRPTASSHGTHVAGTIAAASNGIGVDGVAPSVKIAAIKAMNDNGFLYPEYVTCGFVWSAEHGIDVTNNSYYSDPWEYWVPSDPTQTAGYEAVRRAVAYATSKGVTNVAAAGNSDQNMDDPSPDSGSPDDVADASTGKPYDNGDGKSIIANRDVKQGVDIPADLPGVVTVSAVGETTWGKLGSYARASFSNYGAKKIDVAAPGVNIASTVDPDLDGGSYAYYSGTSMASPHAAGVAALIKGIHPDFKPAQVLELMKKQAAVNYSQLAVPSAADDNKEYRGAGLVNALAAVTQDQPKPEVTAEFSKDGKTWTPLKDATVKGKATIRVKATGSVSALTLTVDGKTDAAKAEKKTHDNELTATVDVDFTAEGAQTATIVANGLNDYEGADDDVNETVAFAAAADPAELPATKDSRDALKAAVDEAAAKKEADYTAASWARFETAVKQAEAVLAKGDAATQGEVDAAAAELKAASDALVKVGEAGEQPGTPGTPGTPTQPGTPVKPVVKTDGGAAAAAQLSKTGASVDAVAQVMLLLTVAGVGALLWRRRA